MFAKATAEELRTAATTVLNTCVRNRGGKGGIVTNVGGFGTIYLRFEYERLICYAQESVVH